MANGQALCLHAENDICVSDDEHIATSGEVGEVFNRLESRPPQPICLGGGGLTEGGKR